MPEHRINLTPADRRRLSALAKFFAARDTAAWATGGFLRDSLLGRQVRDIDVCTEGDPLKIGPDLAIELAAHFVVLDEGRRHVRLVLAGGKEHVDLMPLRAPGIEADLRARDYTINTLAVPLADVLADSIDIIDPTGGLADLRAGLVRLTGEQALIDDPLRLLRGVRIATALGFRIESGTADLLRVHAARLPEAAPERQREELMRIFATERAAAGVRLLEDLGLLAAVLPELDVTRGVAQPKEHYYEVFGHCLVAVEALDWLMAEEEPAESPAREVWRDLWAQLALWEGIRPDGRASARDYFGEEVAPGVTRKALLKFCGILHDIGKPETKSVQADGRTRFFGHSEVGAKIAARLMRRLRFSGREVLIVRNMIEAHLRPVQMAQERAPSRRAVYRYFRDTGEAGIDTLFLSLGDHAATAGPRLRLEGFQRHVAVVAYILHLRFEQPEAVSPPKLVSGEDLIEALGLEPGPRLGQLLEAVREAQAAGEIETREEALALARRLWEQSERKMR